MHQARADEFRALAEQYCTALEREDLDAETVTQLLTSLLAVALRLPDIEPTDDVPSEDPAGLDDDARAVASRLRHVFGEQDLYWDIYDPRVKHDPVAGSLWDDLTDIYRDLRRGLHAYDVCPGDGIWEWRFSLDTHWGHHATDALRVLFRLARS